MAVGDPRQLRGPTSGGLTHLSIQSLIWSPPPPPPSCKGDQIKITDYMDMWVTLPKRATSPAWGPPPPCKQALRVVSKRVCGY